MEVALIEELEAVQSIYSPDEVEVTGLSEAEPAKVTLKVNRQPVASFCVLAAKYPSEIPQLIPHKEVNLVGLKEHLQTELGGLVGSPFLCAMVEAAREWLEKTPLERELNTQQILPQNDVDLGASKSTQATPKKVEVCRFYLQKKCKFGSKCHNYHPGAPQVQSAQATPTESKTTATRPESVTSSNNTNQSSKHFEEAKEKQPQHDTSTGKKAPLKQAADVISRILWDPDLQTEDFTIGYLDRFTGIIEKPFSAFSWEDLASVGHNVLAVPKHRIQYFKYKDQIIWDKRCQLDNVFGSRGGKVITDIVTPPKPSASSGGDKQETPEAKPAVEIKLIEDDDSVSQKVGYSNADRPTHFICVRVHNSQVVENVDKIMQHIRSRAPDLAMGCVSLKALHVTLCMLRVESDKQKSTAMEVIKNLQRSYVQILPPSTKLEFTGVGNFHGRLLYAKVVPHYGLTRFVATLMDQLQKAGVRTPGNFAEYTPHMTLLRLSRSMQREAHTATIVPALYSKFTDSPLGTQKIDTLRFCIAGSGPQEDGFFATEMKLPHSLSCLPPSFVSIVSDRINQLADKAVISSDEKESLLESLVSQGKDNTSEKFDCTIDELERLTSDKNIPNISSHVVILRGLPGSGKSFLARQCSEYLEDPSQVAVCSADNFFTNKSSYSFDMTQLHSAHLHCFDQYLSAILEHKKVIIIDNTNTQLWEYQAYVYVCKLLAIPHTILEVPCLDAHMLDTYRSRCVHKVDHAAALSMYQRWQKDKRAVLAPPTLSHPALRKSDEKKSFSILSLCHPPLDLLESSEPLLAYYTAVFLTTESQWMLLSTFPPTHPDVIADHVTLAFEPSLNSLLHTKIGKRVKVKVISAVEDKNIQAAVVVLPRGLSSENQFPHITLSKQEQALSKDSNKLLESKKYMPMKDREIILEGKIGLAVRKDEESDPQVILSGVDYHNIQSRIQTNETLREATVPSLENISICTGAQDVTQLFVFDFDLTLFDSVDPKDGREIYQRATGKTWPHRGWLGHPESLMPPLSVLPGPAFADYHDHQERAGSLTVVVTARIERTRKAVERALEEAQLYPDAVYCKPDSTSDSETSAHFKVRILEKLIAENRSLRLVKFWDDKADNLTAVKEIAKKYPNISIQVIDATKIVQKKQDSALHNDLALLGCHLSTLYDRAATVGVDFLSSQYCKMIGYEGNPKDVCHVFGSYPIGRRSDIDMCCLLQSPASPFDCIDKFAKQLEDCGIIFLHKGMSSRCPRLKVKLLFDCAPPVAYDLIFAVVDNNLTQGKVLPSPSSPSSNRGIISTLKPADSRSKVALTGPNFMQQVIEAIDGKISAGEFGMVVEMTVQILRAFRQKGNAYHCIRTFHIVRLLMEYVRSPKFSQINDSNCDDIFRNFMPSVAEIPPAKWQKLFGDFVPKEYIPRIVDVFATVSKKLSDLPSGKPLSTQIFSTDFNSRPSFPPQGYSAVSFHLHGASKPSLWKLASLLEARLQSFTRRLIDARIDLVPDGNDSYEKFTFAVPQADVGSTAFKSSLKNLTDEIAAQEEGTMASLRVEIV